MIDIQQILLDATTWGVEAAKINSNLLLLANAIEAVPTVVQATLKSVNNIFPDSSGNVMLDAAQVGAIPNTSLGTPNGVPSLGLDSIIAPQFLPEQIRGDALGFRGYCTVDTVPSKGFYVVLLPGTYSHFPSTDGTAVLVNQFEMDSNIVLIYSEGSHYKKILIPIPQTTIQISAWDDITGKPEFANIAYTGSYKDLIDAPALAQVAFTGNYFDLENRPALARVAVSGLFSDLAFVPDFIKKEDLNQPTFPPALDNSLKLSNDFLTDSAKQRGGMVFIGVFTPSRDPRPFINLTTADVWCFAIQPGTYNYFSFQHRATPEQPVVQTPIVVTKEELAQYLVIIYGRTNFQKYRIPLPIENIIQYLNAPFESLAQYIVEIEAEGNQFTPHQPDEWLSTDGIELLSQEQIEQFGLESIAQNIEVQLQNDES